MRTLALLLTCAGLVAAQDLTHKAPPQNHPILIQGATVHPVSGPAIESGHVLFDKGRIVAIGAGALSAEGARVIDARGKHVYPGFICPHTDLGLREIGAVRASRDFSEVGEIKPEVRAAVAVNPDSTLIPVARSNGILTFAAFPRGGALPGRASVMRVDGWTWEDMALRADAGVVVTWPRWQPRQRRFGPRAQEAADEDAIRKQLQRIRQAFADARAYVAARKADPSMPTDIRWEAMRPVLARERPVFFLAQDYDQIVTAVDFAVEAGLRPILVGGHDAPLCADLLKKHDVSIIVQSIHRFPKRSDSPFDEAYALPARLEAAGLKWCLASGEGAANDRNLPYAAARAVAYGLAREAALKSITLYAAQVLGLGSELGSLEKGKRATLMITDGDPLEVTTRIEQAFIDGRAIDLSNKQTKLYAKYREKYRQLGLVK